MSLPLSSKALEDNLRDGKITCEATSEEIQSHPGTSQVTCRSDIKREQRTLSQHGWRARTSTINGCVVKERSVAAFLDNYVDVIPRTILIDSGSWDISWEGFRTMTIYVLKLLSLIPEYSLLVSPVSLKKKNLSSLDILYHLHQSF